MPNNYRFCHCKQPCRLRGNPEKITGLLRQFTTVNFLAMTSI
ncbi:MAG: hypothetical protein O7C71_01065 [Rickettsia endosymbiont of Ixodes ricinus]|nr:hypothetical protein [Rickettsia endosymbiont of Ixodes ricinus]